jgi:hypothetical protein
MYAVQWPFSKGKMRAVGLMEEFALGAAVVVVAAKENMTAMEVVGMMRGMAAGMTSVHVTKAVKPIGMKWVGRGRWQAIP